MAEYWEVCFLYRYDSLLILSSPNILPLTGLHPIIPREFIYRSHIEHGARTAPLHWSGAENHHRHTQRGFAYGVSDPQLSFDPR
jgi:hypothetical protein